MIDLAPTDRVVSGGQVPCPLRRTDTTVEACWGCRWLEKADLRGATRLIRCAPRLGPIVTERPLI